MKVRESGGVVVAFVGLVLLIAAVKGTLGKVWTDLTTGGNTAPVPNGGAAGSSSGLTGSGIGTNVAPGSNESGPNGSPVPPGAPGSGVTTG